MTRTGLVIAAHGSYDGSAANDLVRGYADAVARLGRFDEVAEAFHLGTPSLSNVLDEMRADDVTVVPLMTSEGFYYHTVLPRDLAANRRFQKIRVRRTRPVGSHPRLSETAVRRVEDLRDQYGLRPDDTSLIIAGHGTERQRSSRLATFEFAAACGRRFNGPGVLVAFLDEQPYIDDALDRVRSDNAIVVPFLIGGGQHSAVDVPARMGVLPTGNGLDAQIGRVGSHFVICDVPVGTYPEITDIIVELAESATNELVGPEMCEAGR
jgi:sirohydrochlorin ferrochelatase